jgi:TolB protein
MFDPPDGVPREPEPDPASNDDPGVYDAPGPDADADEPISGSPARRRLRAAVAITLIAAIVVFGALGGSRLVQTSEDPPAPVRPARLVTVDGIGALSTRDATGGSAIPWSVPGVVFSFPVWSPDGTHVAALGQDLKSAGVYVFAAPPADGGAVAATDAAPRVIYEDSADPAFYLYWTPDSRNVSFLTQEPSEISLRIAPADGAAEARTLRQGAPLYWEWVDGGRLLAHVGGTAPDSFLGELGLDPAAPPASLDPSAPPGAFRSPAVTVDGRLRAYLEASGSTQHLVLEARDGSSSHRIDVAGPTAMSFDPTGSALAFVAPEPADSSSATVPIGPLRLADPADGSTRTLLPGKVVGFFWAPDGKTIAALAVSTPGDDGVQAVAPGNAALAAYGRPPRAVVELGAAIQPAAGIVLHLAFIDVASGAARGQRDVRVTDTFIQQVLPFFDQYALSHRFWSAESRSIALPLVGVDGKDQLVVIPADGSDPTSITGQVIGFWSP